MTQSHDRAASRTAREIEHGRWLARGNSEDLWGWGTPAGQWRAARRARLIAKGARLAPGCRAIEIGCGTGLFTEMFATSGATMVAVDVSEALLTRARARAIPGATVEFRCGRFEDLDLSARFDAAIGSSVLHHLELEPALAQMHRLLRPGGLVSFAEPNMLNPQVFLERHLRRLFKYVSPDETAFIRWALGTQLRRHGFHDVRILPFDWLHPATPAWARRGEDRAGSVLERIPIVREFAGSLLVTCRRE